VPIVFWVDATFKSMVDFYPSFNGLHRESLENGNRMEEAAISRAALAIYSSEWVAMTCLDHYRVDPAKVEVVPFGPNLERERSPIEVDAMIQVRSQQNCRFIYVGTDWQRKGGALNLRLVEALNRAGLRFELEIVGCRPLPENNLPEYVKVIGYLDISTPSGMRDYEAHLSRAHFLILPTQADCKPRVICEANAMGVPCITSDVGGLPSMILKISMVQCFSLMEGSSHPRKTISWE
jgi:glycosyltransferase involved in cell wall biosynthesis